MVDPATKHPPPSKRNEQRRRDARRALAVGAVFMAFSAVLVFSPLVLGRWALNKYLVAFGLFGALLGASVMLNGVIDWFRSGRRPPAG